MVLQDAFGDERDNQPRIDLLCLDTNANLVVVELKCDDDGGHTELQALRHAAMVSSMTFDQATDMLAQVTRCIPGLHSVGIYPWWETRSRTLTTRTRSCGQCATRGCGAAKAHKLPPLTYARRLPAAGTSASDMSREYVPLLDHQIPDTTSVRHLERTNDDL